MLRRAISQRKKKKRFSITAYPWGELAVPFFTGKEPGWTVMALHLCLLLVWSHTQALLCTGQTYLWLWGEQRSPPGVITLGFHSRKILLMFLPSFFTIPHKEREWALLVSPLGWAVVTKTPLSLLLLDDGQTPKRVAKKSHWLAWTKYWIELGESFFTNN